MPAVPTFTLRPITHADGDAFAALLKRSADAGAFQVSSRFRVDPWVALRALHGEFDGVVAEEPGTPGLVGCGLVRYLHAHYEGAVRDVALLNTLVVDPAHRRKGLASALAEWRVAHARAKVGPDGVVCAGIQMGNLGSVRTASRWAKYTAANVIGLFPMPPRRTRPRAVKGLEVREAREGDYATYAERLNERYRDYEFFPPESAASLASFLAETPAGTPYRFAYVVRDPEGEMLAGLVVAELSQIRTTFMVKMPTPIWLLNHVIRIVPRDRHMREASVSRFWFRPGAERAATYLWEVLRWEWRERASTFMLWTDPRAPLAGLMKPLPFMPKSTGSLVIDAPVPPADGRLVYPMM